ncbi:amidase signature domain-containing protein [Amylostereum chailletii]|nr:amidase signature domain-containing protein [Amylostereum chailletii]
MLCCRKSLFSSWPSFRRLSTESSNAWLHEYKTKNGSVNAIVGTISASSPQRLPSDADTLKGVTVAIKDNICTADFPTTCSSAMLQNFTSPFDATVINHLHKSGATIIGKANCDEFGMGSLNTHSVHGPVVNPFQLPGSSVSWEDRPRHSAGGSSGGSAAAVAANICDAALGTDTGGSIRLPASYCGVVGLKPSYGLISRWGVVSFADSLDCVGVIGKDVNITKEIFECINEYDKRDPTAVCVDIRTNSIAACEKHMSSWSSSTGDLRGLRIGVPQEYFPEELSGAIIERMRKVLRGLKERGATLLPVSLPNTAYALSAYYVIASAEASSNLARYDGVQYGLSVTPPPDAQVTSPAQRYAYTRTRGFGPEVKKRILLGTYALTADAFDNYFLQAQRVRNLIKSDFRATFLVPDPLLSSTPPSPSDEDRVHVLLHPSAIQTAPPLPDGSSEKGMDLDAYVQDVLTVPASLAGLPAVSVPVPARLGSGTEWPVGVSVVGQWGCEEMVLRVASEIETLGL